MRRRKMTIDILELDPVSVQSGLVSAIESNDFIMEDPTNPLAMLLEAEVSGITDVSDSIINLERRLFPAMSRTFEDLYPHLVDGDDIDMFASPSSTSVRMLIEVQTLLNFGVKSDFTYTAIIPKESNVVVDDVSFMLVNDVKIILNTKRDIYNAFVELLHDGDSVEFDDVGALQTSIVTDSNNVDWVMADIPVKQLDVIIASARIISGYTFDNTQPYLGQLYHVEVYGKDLNGNTFTIKKTYSEDYYDPTEPTAFIQLTDDGLRVRVDSIYCGSKLRGNITVKIWTTNGKLSLDLSNFDTDSFSFMLGGVSDTVEKSVSTKLNYIVFSNSVVNSGVDTRDFETVRGMVINRTNGKMDAIITDYQVGVSGKQYQFDIHKSTDLITNRTYIASKVYDNNSLIDAPTTVSNFRAKVWYDALRVDDKLIVDDNYTLIKPGKLFEVTNGLCQPLQNEVSDKLKTLSNVEKRTLLNNTEVFFTPFLYITETDIGVIENRVYHIDTPKADFLTIDAKNTFINISVNIVDIHIFRSGDGYDVLIELVGNSDYENDKSNIGIQLKLSGEVGSTYYHSAIDDDKTSQYFPTQAGMHYIRIDSSLFINENDRMDLSNGYTDTGIADVMINDTASLIIYTTNDSIDTSSDTDASNFLSDTDIVNNDDVTYGITKEHVTLEFAIKLEHIWNRVNQIYNGNKYKVYENDVEATYDKDIYELVDGRPFTVIKNDDGSCEIDRNIIHTKGDTILDDDGNIVYVHRRGDIIYDEFGDPIIDTRLGIVKYIDILMLEYKYVAFNNVSYIAHIDDIIKNILTDTTEYLPELTNKLLERTDIFYRPIRNTNYVISASDVIYDTIISPVVTLYISKDKVFNLNIDELHTSIGSLLNDAFSNIDINISVLEENIKSSINTDILAINVSGYSPKNEKLIHLKSDSNRFSIKKTITNDYSITYDYKLEIETL